MKVEPFCELVTFYEKDYSTMSHVSFALKPEAGAISVGIKAGKIADPIEDITKASAVAA